jgi:hypothetical protein
MNFKLTVIISLLVTFLMAFMFYVLLEDERSNDAVGRECIKAGKTWNGFACK